MISKMNLGTDTAKDFALGQRLVQRLDYGDTTVFDPYTTLTAPLPLAFNSRVAGGLKDYKVYGDADGAGVQTENLWDFKQFEKGFYDDNGNLTIQTGQYRTEHTDLIPTNECFAYTILGLWHYANVYNSKFAVYEWDENKNWLRKSNRQSPVDNTPIMFSIGTDAKYISFQVENDDTDWNTNVMLVSGSTAPTSYIPPGYKIPILNTSGVTENLFDKDDIIAGYSIDIYGNVVSNSNFGYTNFIDVNANSAYTICNLMSVNQGWTLRVHGYDNNDEWVSQIVQEVIIDSTYRSDVSFSTPNNVTKIRLSLGIVDRQDVNVLMLVPGSTVPAQYIPHRYTSNYDLMIGSTKLGAEEYVDYQEQKVYKLKEVHKDTVTINGIEWDILGYDHDTVYKSDNTLAQHSVTIQAHDYISELQFDAKEALFAFPEGLAAGTYHFTVSQQPWYAEDVGKTMQFTLVNAIPADGVIVLGNSYNATMIGSTISVYASCSATTATETATISEGSDGTDLGSVGNAISGNTNSIQRALLGNNNYNESAIRQYLNSDGEAGTYWTSQNKWDRPPTWNASTAGFLRGFNSGFVSAIGKASKRTAKNTVSDGGGYIDTEEKIFLLSRTEVYAGDNNSISEGTAYKYYSDYSDLSSAGTGADSNRIKYRNNVAKYWWLRSSSTGGASYPFGVHPSGTVVNYYNTMSSYGVAPACCIVLDDIDTNPYLQSLFLKPTDPLVPLPAIQAYKGENVLSSTETVGDVTVKGRIAPMYRQVEYLKSTGTQVIDTDIPIDSFDEKIDIDVQFGSALSYSGISDVNRAICGTSNPMFVAYCKPTSVEFYLGYGWSSSLQTSTYIIQNPSYSSRNHLVLKRGSSTWGSSSVPANATISQTIPGLYALAFFGGKTSNGVIGAYKVFEASIYGVKIYDSSNNVVHDIIPAERYDGVLGLYDKSTAKFYTNAGEGTFIKGGYVT